MLSQVTAQPTLLFNTDASVATMGQSCPILNFDRDSEGAAVGWKQREATPSIRASNTAARTLVLTHVLGAL